CRTYDESGTLALMRAKKRERLHRFTKAHLVRQDAAEIVCSEAREPFETYTLILAQFFRERTEFRLRIRRRLAAGDELLQCFATIGDGGAKLTRGLFDIGCVGAVDAVKPGLGLRRIAIAYHLLEILQAHGVDHREVTILQSRLRLAGAKQPLNLCVRKYFAAGRRKRVTHLEPILTRAHNLELRRDALDLAAPLLDLRGKFHLPVALQSRIVGREETDNIRLAVKNEAAGICSGEAILLEPRDRRVLCIDIPHQHSIRILWITKYELILRVGQSFDRRAVA